MMKSKKRTLTVLVIALVLCFISMIGGSLVQANLGKTAVSDHNVTLADLAASIRANNEQTGRDIKIDFTEDTVSNVHFRLFVPENASADNPVPGIVCAHGGDNTLEVQLPFYVELARRGFVVISMDFAGHGETDNAINALTSESNGMLALVEYLMSLPYVDNENVGVTGHSMGNLCSINTIKVLNVADSTQRVRAWVEGDGTLYAFNLTEELAEGLIMTMNVGKHSEMDVIYVGAYDFLGTENARSMVKIFYPEFSDERVTEGQWYTKNGPVDSVGAGQKLEQESAYRLYNNENTHPGWHFSLDCTAIAIDGFYAAFGVPTGATLIDPSDQIWPVSVAFGFIGLVGFFMLLFPLCILLVNTKFFSSIKHPVRDKELLPSIKDPREAIIALATLAIIVVFSYFSYVKLYPIGSSLFDSSLYPASVPNAIGFWSAVCGVFLLAMILVNYAVKRLVYAGSGVTVANPFESARLDSVSQFFKTILFAVVVLAIMYIPVYIAEAVFMTDFRVCSLAVQLGDLNKLYVIIVRYLPMWLLFFIVNAIFNANTRYRDVPEWVSALVCAVANCLALLIFIYIQYSTILTQGVVPYPDMTMGGIAACFTCPFLAFAGFSARYIYKKTGNAWAAGIINGSIACLMSLYGSWIANDLTFY